MLLAICFYFVYRGVLSVCMSVGQVYVESVGARVGVGSPDMGVIDSCDPLCVFWVPNFYVSEDLPEFLSFEPTIQLQDQSILQTR